MRTLGWVLLVCLLCLLHIAVWAQHPDARIEHLGKDSLPKMLIEDWRYMPGDDTSRAAANYPDAGWVLSWSQLNRENAKQFSGKGWWRRRISIDSTLVGKPLGLVVEQSGASELYVDGVLLTRFGEIGAHGECLGAYTAGGQPFAFVLPRAGTYQLAMRYVEAHKDPQPGFTMKLWPANRAINQDRNAIAFAGVSFFLFGIFLAFGILHGVMFMYYRAAESNLWFAGFSISLAFIFGVLLTEAAQSVEFVWLYFVSMPYLIMLGCFCLSGFINSVFFKRRPWFRILIVAATPMLLVSAYMRAFVTAATVVSASIETVFTIGFAIYRRLPGARIIGAGLLLFSLLLLYFFAYAYAQGGSGLSIEGTEAAVTLVLCFVAVLCIPLSMSVYLARSFANVSRELRKQLVNVERLSGESLKHEAEKQHLLKLRGEELEQEVAIRTEELRGQKQKSDDLLLNILPAEVAEELKEYGKSAARKYDEVSVLFTDFVDFTQHSEALSPEELVAEIDTCFQCFDEIINRHGLEKIKTVGDAYIAVSGLPTSNPNHARDVVRAGLEIRTFMEARMRERPGSFGIRLGVHSGPVVAGIVGLRKFAYDIWGDTVNTAARMEQHSEPGELNISETTIRLLKDNFSTTARGELEVKHKGKMHMYFVHAELTVAEV